MGEPCSAEVLLLHIVRLAGHNRHWLNEQVPSWRVIPHSANSLLFAVHVCSWVLFNILGPLQNQLDAMGDKKRK